MKKPPAAMIRVDEATTSQQQQQRVSSHFGGGAVENSQVLSARGEKSVARGGEADEQPREGGQESVVVDKRGDFAAICKWTIVQFSKVKAKSLWSKYFEVGGYDCRLLVYPKGDGQALPGHLSIYLQVTDPKGSSKWDCFASYRLCVVNQREEGKSIQRDSWHRFSARKRSHGWCDFTPSSVILDPKSGFMVNDSILITTEILILNETVAFSRENEMPQSGSEVLSGKFTWKVQNLSLFREMIKTQKIMSPAFSAGECNLRMSVYQSSVNGVDHLSMCLESKDTEKSASERSCWCLFRMSVLNQKAGSTHMHRDSYGRFAGDNRSGDNTSLGWNDYMKMADFLAPEMGYLVNDSATFSASFHVIKEISTFTRISSTSGGVRSGRRNDGYQGKFTWKIENFTKLKDLLKKRKITGLCIKSRRFQVGNRDCRLIVYPRGQSQPPCHLSMFLEVTDPRTTSADWSCFVSHRLSVVNQRTEDRSVSKESQNRYCKAAKDWGWREFITLTNLFDQDSGFLVQDTVTFSAEVLILKETSAMEDRGDVDLTTSNRGTFTWRVENFVAFKEIMETRKIFSKFFQAGGCELRIGVYESFDTLCIYLESDQPAGTDLDHNFWVRYRMAVVNQKYHERTVWKESSICTKTWNNSVLQFMKVSDMIEPDAGFLLRDTIVFVCEILDCCPWFEFSDLEVLVSDDEPDALSTDPDELLESDDSETNSIDEEDIFRSLLARAGFHLSYGDNPQLLLDPSQLQSNLREKLLLDGGAVAAFLTGLRVYLDDPSKVRRLLLPTRAASMATLGKPSSNKVEATSPSLMNLFMGVKVLQQEIVDLLLDIMVECCQPASACKLDVINGKCIRKTDSGLLSKAEPTSKEGPNGKSSSETVFTQRLDDADSVGGPQAVQSSDVRVADSTAGVASKPAADPTCSSSNHANELRYPEQSEELLGLIVNTLRALDNAVPPTCSESRRRPQSAHKMVLVLEKAPKYLHQELLALVPKLVDPSEHALAAIALLQWLHKADIEQSARLKILNALTQLRVGTPIWERIYSHTLSILSECNGDLLAAVVTCVFKTAVQCHQSLQGAKAVRGRLKRLGPAVAPRVLEVVRTSVHNFSGTAEALLRDIDTDCERSENDGPSVFNDGRNPGLQLQAAAEHYVASCSRVADVDVLVEMLTLPSLRLEAQRVFERSIAKGAFGEQTVAMVLERRRSERLRVDSRGAAQCLDTPAPSSSIAEDDDDFPAVLGLAEALSRSKDARIREFVSTLYAIMFKVYGDGGYRERMLRGLVERATSSENAAYEVKLGMDILTVLVREEEGSARPVLNMMREAAESANMKRASLWQQLRSNEDELTKVRNDKQSEVSRLTKEKTSLSQKLSEAEAVHARLKSESRDEIDRLAKEKRDVAEQLRDAESQLEWARSEREEETAKFASEKKACQEKLRDTELQLANLKSRKREELKRATKDKAAVAEKLKSAESARKNAEDEAKRLMTDLANRVEEQRSLEKRVKELEQMVRQKDAALGEKAQQISECATYISSLKTELQTEQERIKNLQFSLHEEMNKHAPLYGFNLEALEDRELVTLARIHDEGLRMVQAIQHSRAMKKAYGEHGPPMAVATMPSMLGNGLGNGHISGTWYPPS